MFSSYNEDRFFRAVNKNKKLSYSRDSARHRSHFRYVTKVAAKPLIGHSRKPHPIDGRRKHCDAVLNRTRVIDDRSAAEQT